MTSAKLSSKYQIVIPKEIRNKLNLKKGTRVNVYFNGDSAVITKTPKSYVDALDGLGADIWKSLGGTDKYIEGERNSWDKR